MSDDREWYKDAIIYQLHVRAYKDSNADGIGDFAGLTEQLDYLQDLGVTTLWILPFYPSPLKDDGYDIADYTDVNPMYGNLDDFQTFLDEAHRRGLRVITELVLNHTSDQHRWFRRARKARPGDPARDFYVWSETNQKYTDVRIIFKDFERSNWTWDVEANAYFWHRFYSHQPDLNFDNPEVHRALERIFDFWMEKGVDGFRLDAIPYLFEREGTSSENLPETHEYIRQLRHYVDERSNGNIMLLAEANMWPDDAVQYFGAGDECHMAFHFPVMPRLYMAVQMEDRYPIVDILQQTPAIPPNSQWATFLRNHDELTLEMVTDEDRDYMYRVYAHDPQARINLGIRRRLAPLMGNNRRRIELMNALLFSLPGTPIIYYGDEIGMGDNIYLGDRNGVRTPMQWSGDRNAGFSRANPQRLYSPIVIDPEYHYEAVNVEAQQNNPQSLLWWMKRLIALRKQYRALGRGTIEFLHPDNPRVLAFVRTYEEECILVVVNLSRFAQNAQLDLGAYQGLVPIEMFGRTPFPQVTDQPYAVTLAPHVFYWFSLEKAGGRRRAETGGVRTIRLEGRWQNAVLGPAREQVEAILGEHLRAARWFRSKAREVAGVDLVDAVPVPCATAESLFCMLEVRFIDGESETYAVPLAVATGERSRALAENPQALLAHLETDGGEPAVLYDALYDEATAIAVVEAVARGRRCRGEHGELLASHTAEFTALGAMDGAPGITVLKGEQSNTSIVVGDRLLLKAIRKVESGINPELEIGRYLTEQAGFRGAPRLLGALEYRRGREEPATLVTVHEFVPSEGDAWSYTIHELGRYYERVAAQQPGVLPEEPEGSLVELAERPLPEAVQELVGGYLERVRLLGQRTAEMHLALALGGDSPAFAPEPIVAHYRRGRVESFRNLARFTLLQLRRSRDRLSPESQAMAERVLRAEGTLVARVRTLLDRRIGASRIRVHGDYHLGQVLFTGKDFVILDFEGEPARSLGERRFKRSALRDVAGMIRSFEYAAAYALRLGPIRAEDQPALRPWGRLWSRWAAATFLQAYLRASAGSLFLPAAREEVEAMLEYNLLEKAVYELRYELNNRPDWVTIPLEGILDHLEPVEVEV